MSNALTLADMSPGLRKVMGRESPRATSAEEPDAGNPLVRIWRGAGVGNLPAYSTKRVCTGILGVHPWIPLTISQVMAVLRNTAIGLMRWAGHTSIFAHDLC